MRYKIEQASGITQIVAYDEQSEKIHKTYSIDDIVDTLNTYEETQTKAKEASLQAVRALKNMFPSYFAMYDL